MKNKHKILTVILGLILLSWLVYATLASNRKSTKLPWQWIPTWFHDPEHNVWVNYLPESRFSFYSWSIVWNWIVLDSITWLYWQSAWNAVWTTTWELAKTYCADLELLWFTDWRLPNYKELISIVDLSRVNPSIDYNYFSYNNIKSYWSSTTHSSFTGSAWNVFFYNGNYSFSDKTEEKVVRCVR